MKRFFPYVVLFAACLLVILPMARNVWPETHEHDRYPALMTLFVEALASGIPYPRWMPDLMGGYGLPTFVFYQPGLFFASAPILALVGNPQTGAKVVVLFFLFLGAVGTYQLVREIVRERRVALLAALFYLLTPYLYVDLYVRGALSELAAMLLLPYPVRLLLNIARRIDKQRDIGWQTVCLALATFSVILTHPIIAMFLFPLLLAISPIAGHATGRAFARVRTTSFALVIAVLLAAPYWYPVASMRPFIHAENPFAGYFVAAKHTVHPLQFVSRFYGFGRSEVDPLEDGISFQLGLPHLLAALAGLWIGRKRRLLRRLGLLYLLLLLFMSPISRPLWHLPLWTAVQFPWRLLSVTAILQVMLAAGIADARLGSRSRTALLLGLCFLASLLWYGNQFRISPNSAPLRFSNDRELKSLLLQETKSYQSLDESLPVTVEGLLKPRKAHGRLKPLIVGNASTMTARRMPGSTPYRLVFEITARSQGDLRINQFYFPGWSVTLDGHEVPRATLRRSLDATGLLRLHLDTPGRFKLVARYTGPPGARYRNSMAVLGIILCLYLLSTHHRKRSQCEADQEPRRHPDL